MSDIVLAQDLTALATLTDDQQDMLANILARFSGASSGPIGIDVGEGEGQPLRLPVLKIRQRMTTDPGCPDTARDGDLYTTAGDLIPRPVKFMPLAIWTSHTKFEGGGGRTVECYSPDSKQGSTFGKCSACPYEPWKNGNKTECDRTLNTIIMTDTLALFHVRFASMSYPAGKNLIRFARAMPNLWSRFFKLETSSRKNQKGEFQVFEVKAVQDMPSADVQKVGEFVCRQLAESRKGMLEGFYARVNGGGAPQSSGGQTAELLNKDGSKVKVVTIDNEEPDFSDM
jgi:hypothetical protein